MFNNGLFQGNVQHGARHLLVYGPFLRRKHLGEVVNVLRNRFHLQQATLAQALLIEVTRPDFRVRAAKPWQIPVTACVLRPFLMSDEL